MPTLRLLMGGLLFFTTLACLAADTLPTIRDCAVCPEMVALPAGRFRMGSDPSEPGRDADESAPHSLALAAFAMARSETTREQWRALMGDDPSSFPACGAQCPVNQVDFDDARLFAERLSAKTGQRYRLPTEAEWEYACRAGESALYCGGDDAPALAWFQYPDAPWGPQPVGQKQANAWGLVDMSGNVAEWVADCGDAEPARSDPGLRCRQRVVRGGAWLNSEAHFVRAAGRAFSRPQGKGFSLGFRVVRELE